MSARVGVRPFFREDPDMPRLVSLPKPRRGFEFSRLGSQLLALAYERLLPTLRRARQPDPKPPRRAATRHAATT
jgi:hypothetical protein